MRKAYESKLFHWSYIFSPLLFPLIVLMWLTAKMSEDDPKPFRKAIKATLFNKHTCEFHDDVIDGEFRKCKNEVCNIVTSKYADGTWISPLLRRLEKETNNETN